MPPDDQIARKMGCAFNGYNMKEFLEEKKKKKSATSTFTQHFQDLPKTVELQLRHLLKVFDIYQRLLYCKSIKSLFLLLTKRWLTFKESC